MKAKYFLLIAILAATVACSRDEESLFDKPAAIRAQEAIDNAIDVLTSQKNGWEMAYFPLSESTAELAAKGYNIVLRFDKSGYVSATAKNATTTQNKMVTDTASTWAVKSDYGPILTFDTYNDVFHAWSDPEPDGAGQMGDYEFLILKATPEVVVLKGKKRASYSVMRPMKNADLASYFAATENMMATLFGNNNIVALNQDGNRKYLYNGSTGQFLSAEYGKSLVAETATVHPVCATEDGIIVSTGFGEDIHEHIFLYDSVNGELRGESGTLISAGNLNLLYRSYFADNSYGWTVTTPDSLEQVASFLEQVNTLVKDTKKSTNIKALGYGYKQSLNMYEGGHFILLQFGYKQNGKGKEQVIKLIWTVDITVDENEGITISNPQPYDDTTNRWITNMPIVVDIMQSMVGTFQATPGANRFNAAAGMNLEGKGEMPITLPIKGVNTIKM